MPERQAISFGAGSTGAATGHDLALRRVGVTVIIRALDKTSLTGDSTERVDTRVLQVIYSFHRSNLPIYVGQQMDVYIDAPAPGFEPPVCCRNFLREKPAINRYFEFPGVRKLKQVDRPLTHLVCT